MKVRVYIDGFNLYHSIDDFKDNRLKWLDVKKLASIFLTAGESIDKVLFFTALPTYLLKEASNPTKYKKADDKINRHRLYVRALEETGTVVNLGTFKTKPAKCFGCGTEWLKHEEKESDVSIGIEFIRDAIQNKFDRALFISADTDFAPAIKMATQEFKKRVTLLVPPHRRNFNNLARAATDFKSIEKHHIQLSQLPDSIVTSKGGTITKPTAYQ